jgi:hypothetical protein
MRALTLTQPWAGLVASGIKLVENRPRPMIKSADVLAKSRIAIHASREIDEYIYDRIYELAPELNGGYGWAPWWKPTRITSAVIAVATLRDAMYIGGCSDVGIRGACERMGIPDQVRWTFGPTCYVLADVVALPSPVKCRGWQGFWTLAPELERAVMEQLA